jgi:hypothetical protein
VCIKTQNKNVIHKSVHKLIQEEEKEKEYFLHSCSMDLLRAFDPSKHAEKEGLTACHTV